MELEPRARRSELPPRPPHVYYLEMIVGPMFSGKSEELIRRVRRERSAPGPGPYHRHLGRHRAQPNARRAKEARTAWMRALRLVRLRLPRPEELKVPPSDPRRRRSPRHVTVVAREDALDVPPLELVDDELP